MKMETTNNNPPKTFISYSWTNPEHEQWVLQLATQLVENGVDVILDKWKLREGADKYVFMEKMVTDPSVTKVIMICDKAYAEKADSRKGGVGTETQVISGEIYSKVEDNKKFVAVIREKDEEGHAYLPKYLKSRIFIDMSDFESESQNFEQLLRWVFDRPVYQKPELGKPPTYIFEDNPVALGTNSKHRLAVEAVKQNKPNAGAAVRDYFEIFAENFSQFTIEPEKNEDFEQKILDSIESFLPYRNEAIDVFSAISKYSKDTEVFREISKFFELLLPYTATRPLHKNNWTDGETDNLRFLVHELFLYGVAIIVKNEKFEEGSNLLSQNFYSKLLANAEGLQINSFNYCRFNTYFVSHSLRHKNDYENLQANLIKNRAIRRDISFEDLMQADFLLYFYSLIHLEGFYNEFDWYPFTNSFAAYRQQPYEVFSRAQSSRYFERLKTLLIIDSKKQIEDLFQKSQTESGYIPSFSRVNSKLPLQHLINLSKLATTP